MPIPVANMLRMAGSVVAHRALGQSRLLNLMLAVTDRCTARCRYCQLPARESPEMTTAEIRALLDEAADLGCQRLGLWGGEPLLRDDLGEIVQHARQLGLFVTIDTNGHLVPQRLDVVRAAHHVNISLDGDEADHDAYRGRGTWRRTLAGLRAARAAGLPVWTITVFAANPLEQVRAVLRLAEEHGFLASFQVLHHNDEIGRNEGLIPPQAELRAAVEYLRDRQRLGAPVASSPRYLELLAQWPDYAEPRRFEQPGYPACTAGMLYCNVDVDGGVYPCSLVIDERPAPNVRELGLRGALETLTFPPCNACLGACFTEYNLLYSLDVATGLHWVGRLTR